MNRRRLLLLALLALLPALIHGLLILPSRRRIAALHLRIQAAHAAALKLEGSAPLGAGEGPLLEDPGAPWRTRIPSVAGDGGRLALVDRVVRELGAALRRSGVPVGGMRTVLDPVQLDATPPGNLPAPAPAPAGGAGKPPGDPLGAWVLEVEVPGSTAQLFQALAALPRTGPVLEPVGLRWDRTPGEAGAPAVLHQYLLLRSYYH